MTSYHIPNFFVLSEEDIFEDGCQLGTGNTYQYEQSFDASSQDDLIGKICKHSDVEKDALELNACEEQGRIDIARMECEDGTSATSSELEQWKAGKRKLFYVIYTGHLETRSPIAFI